MEDIKGFIIYDSHTQKSGILSRVGLAPPVDYLNELDHKPYITIPTYCDTKDGFELAKAILHSNIPPSTTPGVAVAYIAKVAETITGKLEDDWKSYDVMIGHKGDTITPLSLLEITKLHIELPGQKTETIPTCTDYGVAAKALLVYRISQAPPDQTTYKANLMKRIGDVFKMEPFCLDSTAGVMNVPHWIQDPAYRTLAAAIEMFLRKFPGHPLEKLRACTLTSYIKDCALLPSVNFAAECLQISPATLLQYIYSRSLADDVRRLIGGGPKEEKLVDHSYFQYMREMNLIPRSPYSASLNANLFVWCQFIGALNSQKRSIHARMVTTANPVILLIFAGYVSYYVLGAPETNVIFADTPEKMEALVRLKQIKAEQKPESEDSASPEAVLQHMKDNNYEFTIEMKEKFIPIVRTIDGSRKDSIGEFVKNYFLGTF